MLSQQILDSLSKFLPETALSATILVILIAELFTKKKTNLSGYIAIIGLVITWILNSTAE